MPVQIGSFSKVVWPFEGFPTPVSVLLFYLKTAPSLNLYLLSSELAPLNGNSIYISSIRPKEDLQKSFLGICRPMKSMAYELFIVEKLSFAEVS